ncbi:MFS transporter [Lentzea sp. NPDC051208]|uniref:MFS transporter n=1 Tax=Lentzea sp. NPDC051208 TaxID=3154642 RepID=UPI00342D42BE
MTGLRALLIAGAVSAFGTQMTMLALPWLVLEASGSATRTGLVFAVQVLPIALLGFLGGEVIQRFGAHRTMLVSDAVRAPLIALVPLLHGMDLLSYPLLLAIVAVLGVFGVPYYAAQRVLATELIGDDPRGMARANSILEGAVNVAAFAGPATAGALIAFFGAPAVLWLDTGTFAFSALLLLLVPRKHGAASRSGPPGVLAGLKHITADAFLRKAVLSTITYGFVLRVLAIALPLLAFERFDENARLGGLLLSAAGAGALAGSLTAVAVATKVEPRKLVLVAMTVMALPLWLLVPDVPVWVLMSAVALTSAAVPVSNAPFFAILTARVPADYRPKVLQSVITLSGLAGPLGFLTAGLLTDGLGITATVVLIAALATLASANVALALRLLTPEAAPPPAAPVAARAG